MLTTYDGKAKLMQQINSGTQIKKIHKKYSRDEMNILETFKNCKENVLADKQENIHFQTNCCTIHFPLT